MAQTHKLRPGAAKHSHFPITEVAVNWPWEPSVLIGYQHERSKKSFALPPCSLNSSSTSQDAKSPQLSQPALLPQKFCPFRLATRSHCLLKDWSLPASGSYSLVSGVLVLIAVQWWPKFLVESGFFELCMNFRCFLPDQILTVLCRFTRNSMPSGLLMIEMTFTLNSNMQRHWIFRHAFIQRSSFHHCLSTARQHRSTHLLPPIHSLPSLPEHAMCPMHQYLQWQSQTDHRAFHHHHLHPWHLLPSLFPPSILILLTVVKSTVVPISGACHGLKSEEENKHVWELGFKCILQASAMLPRVYRVALPLGMVWKTQS